MQTLANMIDGVTLHGKDQEVGGPVEPFAAAVVMPTVLRPTLESAVASLFAQDLKQRCQLLIGIDKPVGDPNILSRITRKIPANWSLTVLNLGYSTSVRHGGLHLAKDGGALRTILSYAAHSRFVAFLDDDNWLARNHLSSLLEAVQDHDYAFSLRWFVDAATKAPVAVDRWESVGPDRGLFNKRFGGFIDPNTLMIDKLKCEEILRAWTMPLPGDPKGMSADRRIFHLLKSKYRGAATNKPSCFYVMDPKDGMHQTRLDCIKRSAVRESAPEKDATPKSQSSVPDRD